MKRSTGRPRTRSGERFQEAIDCKAGHRRTIPSQREELMKNTFPVKEGKIPFRGFKTWYRVVGEREEPGKFPLICLHGGPGIPSDYIEPMRDLAATGRRVIFYDQLGCGNSDRPHQPS